MITQTTIEWHYCEEQLPDDDTSVIVAIDIGDDIAQDIAHHDTGRGGWIGERSNRLIRDTVIAWCDWPEVPAPVKEAANA